MKRIAFTATLLLALLSPAVASAAEVDFSFPSAEATRYTWVVVDSRKLRVPLGVALAQLPGEECVGFSDLGRGDMQPLPVEKRVRL